MSALFTKAQYAPEQKPTLKADTYSTGPASDVRCIDPVTGEVIGTIEIKKPKGESND